MNASEETVGAFREEGVLIVRVTAAGTSLPVEGADVRIRGADEENAGILRVLTSGKNWLTEKIGLAAPPADISRSPSGERGYAAYNVEVFKDGFYTHTYLKIPVFSTITSLWEAQLISRPPGHPKSMPKEGSG